MVSQLQLSNSIEIPDQMTQESSIPLFFEAFQFSKEVFYNISKSKDEQPVEIYEVPLKPICNRLQQSFQFFHEPIDDLLDDECNQNISPLN